MQVCKGITVTVCAEIGARKIEVLARNTQVSRVLWYEKEGKRTRSIRATAVRILVCFKCPLCVRVGVYMRALVCVRCLRPVNSILRLYGRQVYEYM